MKFCTVHLVYNESVARWFESTTGQQKAFVGKLMHSFPETASDERIVEVLRRDFQRQISIRNNFRPLIEAILKHDPTNENVEADCVAYTVQRVDETEIPICGTSFKFSAPRNTPINKLAKEMAKRFNEAYQSLDLADFVKMIRGEAKTT